MNVNRVKVITALIFISCTILVYSIFNGIPFGNYIAKTKIENYVEQVYGITEDVQKPQYNFKSSSYLTNLSQIKNEISYDLLHNTIYDERVAEEYGNKFQKEYTDLKKSYNANIELPPAHIYTVILANGKYSNNIYKLKSSQMLYIIGIINRDKITYKDSQKAPSKITKEILNKLSNNFNVTSLQVRYTDLNGSYEIIVKRKKTISEEELQKNTLKMDEIGEEDKVLIRELNK
ncbi:MAG: hypothetical protein K0R71_1702 [Bacillales bacterium]|jgi:uncharacterized protein YlxP (DUF503 family)|nr:hypothetical protein [Bacillales bacterium]